MARRSIVAANWKMNGDLALIDTMISGLANVELQDNVKVVLCPSSPYLSELVGKVKSTNLSDIIHVGAQNVSEHQSGAYTGQISTKMLKELSVEFVIIGHSERLSLIHI